MANLLRCPTCNGLISENAKTCPHCGETKFFEITSKLENGPILECYNCDGRGKISALRFEKNCHVCEGKGRVRSTNEVVTKKDLRKPK